MQELRNLKVVLEKRIQELEQFAQKTEAMRQEAKKFNDQARKQSIANTKNWQGVVFLINNATAAFSESFTNLRKAPEKYKNREANHRQKMVSQYLIDTYEKCQVYREAIEFAQQYITNKKTDENSSKKRSREKVIEEHTRSLNKLINDVDRFAKDNGIVFTSPTPNRMAGSINQINSETTIATQAGVDNSQPRHQSASIEQQTPVASAKPAPHKQQWDTLKSFQILKEYGSTLSKNRGCCFFKNQGKIDKSHAIKNLIQELEYLPKDEAIKKLDDALKMDVITKNTGTGFGRVTTIDYINNLRNDILNGFDLTGNFRRMPQPQ